MNHRIIIFLLAVLLMATGPAACGMRGDLYLPEDKAATQPSPALPPADTTNTE